MRILVLAVLGLALSGCMSSSCYMPRHEHVYGMENPYHRHDDPACSDCPKKGYKGFKQPIPCTIGS